MFTFHLHTKIRNYIMTEPVKNAVKILERDIDKVFAKTDAPDNWIVLENNNQLEEEAYTINIEEKQILMEASSDLGFIYGLLKMSEAFLEINPFWFWMDQKIVKKEKVEIHNKTIYSPKLCVKYRGWFFNDEVLMLKWAYNHNNQEGWKMCFETLLRCGGNITIPGTDKMARENRQLAANMGLWITHHHAEPLGAEMFVRAYPEIEPNFIEHADLFLKIWEKAVIEQKEYKVVWNLCFRGQGDVPFWATDTSGQFDTPQKRGKLISDIIRKQCDIVKKYVKHPVFCTNLYGEIMELYEAGFLELDHDIIKVRADNGFGKMVTRRRDNHCVRISSMPDGKDQSPQGIYYHVSFYDLQAANHITMLPNSVDFVKKELSQVLENKGDAFWIINCSNVRPHVYYLDVIRKIWFGEQVSNGSQAVEFARNYYNGQSEISNCYKAYAEAMIPYGQQEDEHCGEQFYTENIRILAYQWLVNRTQGAEALIWIAGKRTLLEQADRMRTICQNGIEKIKLLSAQCEKTSLVLQGSDKRLFDTTILLQAHIHAYCAQGVIIFVEGIFLFAAEKYEEAFVKMGDAAVLFQQADDEMRAAEYENWIDFYKNDCFADCKHTAYMIRKVMGIIREYGDNVRHDAWYRKYCYTKEDQSVYLLLVTDNHMADWALYEIMKKKLEIISEEK